MSGLALWWERHWHVAIQYLMSYFGLWDNCLDPVLLRDLLLKFTVEGWPIATFRRNCSCFFYLLEGIARVRVLKLPGLIKNSQGML